MQFYLETLYQDVNNPHEQPSIGAVLCATKYRPEQSPKNNMRSAHHDQETS